MQRRLYQTSKGLNGKLSALKHNMWLITFEPPLQDRMRPQKDYLRPATRQDSKMVGFSVNCLFLIVSPSLCTLSFCDRQQKDFVLVIA